MRWLWPFWRHSEKDAVQRQQIEESLQRVSEASDRRVEKAKERLSAAADGASEIAEVRKDESTALLDTLRTFIDRQSHGRFNMQRGQSRN